MNGAEIQFVLQHRGALWVRARGQSMRPFISDGTEVLLEPMRGPARRGELVLVAPAGRAMLHRVVDTYVHGGTRFVRTRGDGRRSLDPPTLEAEIAARAVAMRRGGWTVRLDTALANALGRCAAALFPYLWFLRER